MGLDDAASSGVGDVREFFDRHDAPFMLLQLLLLEQWQIGPRSDRQAECDGFCFFFE